MRRMQLPLREALERFEPYLVSAFLLRQDDDRIGRSYPCSTSLIKVRSLNSQETPALGGLNYQKSEPAPMDGGSG